MTNELCSMKNCRPPSNSCYITSLVHKRSSFVRLLPALCSHNLQESPCSAFVRCHRNDTHDERPSSCPQGRDWLAAPPPESLPAPRHINTARWVSQPRNQASTDSNACGYQPDPPRASPVPVSKTTRPAWACGTPHRVYEDPDGNMYAWTASPGTTTASWQRVNRYASPLCTGCDRAERLRVQQACPARADQ